MRAPRRDIALSWCKMFQRKRNFRNCLKFVQLDLCWWKLIFRSDLAFIGTNFLVRQKEPFLGPAERFSEIYRIGQRQFVGQAAP